jgi:serine/threonine-protein kinase RIO1
MRLTLAQKLGDGAFADVWKAEDELGRDVAVKIIRPANAGVADALTHAKALARANHPNVVSVISVERIEDPDSGEEVDCVVMELIEGETLSALANGPLLGHERAQNIGLGIIKGLGHIHAQGMAHGDLHEENVMVTADRAKVIDILYLNSLASLSTENRARRLRRDLLSLRLILQQIILHSEIDSAEATEFNNLLESDASLDDINSAFLQVCSPAAREDDARQVEHAYARLTEENFIEGEEYARALAHETPDGVIAPILKRLIANGDYDVSRKDYVALLWAKLPARGRDEVARELGTALDTTVPKGKWGPCVRLLKLLGQDAWDRLSPRMRLKVEGAVVRDVLAGSKDIHSTKKTSGGALGTYAASLWRRFSKPDVLADNLISLLRQSWFTQNYVGEYFLTKIPEIARVTGKRAEFIKAFRSAVGNDARLIVNNLDNLPDDWVEEIRAE